MPETGLEEVKEALSFVQQARAEQATEPTDAGTVPAETGQRKYAYTLAGHLHLFEVDRLLGG